MAVSIIKKKYRPAAGVLLSALLLSLAFPRYHRYRLALFALVPLLIHTKTGTAKSTLRRFFLCGWLFHTILLQWLWANIFWAGGWAVLAQQGLCLILALFWLLPAGAWVYFRDAGGRYTTAIGFSCFWVGMELLQARLFTGFGWSALGYTQGANRYVAQFASIGSVSLLSFFLVLINTLIAKIYTERQHFVLRILSVILLLGGLTAGGYFLFQEADYESLPLNAGIIQPNFSQEMKWDSDYYGEMLRKTGNLTQSLVNHKKADIVIWPEALLTVDYKIPLFHEALSDIARTAGTYIFTGTVRDDPSTGDSYNSSVLFDPNGKEAGCYDKIRLAAFGEYIPLENYIPFVSRIAFGGITAGKEQQVFSLHGRKLAPLICFEVLFGPMAETLRQKGADALIVVTNLAWFGNSNAILQELEIARMRAIETGLPLLHSANTGVSGVFDPYGRFHTVHHTVNSRGALLDWTEKTQPEHVVMKRFVDAFPVAAPARRLLPGGPVFLPWLLFGLGFLLIAWRQFRQSSLFSLLEGETSEAQDVRESPADSGSVSAGTQTGAKAKAKAPPKKKAAARKPASKPKAKEE